MILKTLTLHNIRSYVDTTLAFPEGRVLLSGNIGSGKSSILLAMEFALFGLQPGILTGSSLLRKGEDTGFVRLTFLLDGKEIIVQRALKKSGSSIAQENGFLIIDGKKRELAPTELKQEIFTLLNYPPSLLTKTKSFIYRSTVYTPQEEMKHILLGDEALKIDVIRRIFGIDKYKRVSENLAIASQKLRERRKELEGVTADLEKKQQELEEKKKELSKIEDNIKQLLPVLSNILQEKENLKNKIQELELQQIQLRELQHELKILEHTLTYQKTHFNKTQQEIIATKNLVISLEKETSTFPSFDKDFLKEKEQELKKLEQEFKNLFLKKKEIMVHQQHAEHLIQNITQLSTCPVCQQEVDIHYKEKVVHREQEKIGQLKEEHSTYQKEEIAIEKKKQELQNEINMLTGQMYQQEVFQIKKKNLEEKKEHLAKILEQEQQLQQEIFDREAKRKDILAQLQNFHDLDTIYKSLQDDFTIIHAKEQKMMIEKATFEAHLSALQQHIASLSQDISEKQQLRKKIQHIQTLSTWILEHYLPLLANIEKRLLLRLHADFNAFFQNWFRALVEDEHLTINLSDSFSPIIEQHGYTMEYTHLSGGEKTAAALAYRLALNQVINTVMSVIKTRDLIILDEPTDGFSDEQLERMRTVFKELKVKQLLIVSHELKIETFVDYVIYLEKHDHITAIVNKKV